MSNIHQKDHLPSQDDDLQLPMVYAGNFEAHARPDAAGWSVWNMETGAEIQSCDSRAEAIDLAHAMNARLNVWYGEE